MIEPETHYRSEAAWDTSLEREIGKKSRDLLKKNNLVCMLSLSTC